MTQCSNDENLIQEIHIRVSDATDPNINFWKPKCFLTDMSSKIVEKQEGHQESSWDGCISVYSQLKRIFEVWNDDVHEDEDVDSYRWAYIHPACIFGEQVF